MSVLSFVFLEVSALGRSLVKRITPECGVSECDGGIPTVRRSRSARAVEL